jgi:hypothetical protein
MTWMMLASVAMAFFFPKMLSGMGTSNNRDRETWETEKREWYWYDA